MARTHQGTGRKKIDIKKIENKLHLKTTFTKRRKGLFKKVEDFCTSSSGVKAGVFTFSQYGRAYAFVNPSAIQVIEKFYAEVDDANVDDFVDDSADQAAEVCEENGEFWWKKPVADVDVCEIDKFRDSLTEYKKNLICRIEDLKRRRLAVRNFFV